MKTARAFSPGHITGLFSIHDEAASPLEKGSIGAGFSISRGVTTTVRFDPAAREGTETDPLYLCNGRPESDLAVSRRVVSIYREMGLPRRGRIEEITHAIDIPQGSGFGSSGAGALSLSLALNAVFGRPLTKEEAGAAAHRAEVECRTGLGTVIGEFYGGFEIRTKAGAPGVGSVLPIRVAPGLAVLFAVYKKISTSVSLSDPDVRGRINSTGEGLVADLIRTPTLESFLWASRAFSERSGLVTPEVRLLFDRFDRLGISCAMLMFGNAVFALFPDLESAEKEAAALSREGEKGYLFVTTPSMQGGSAEDE